MEGHTSEGQMDPHGHGFRFTTDEKEPKGVGEERAKNQHGLGSKSEGKPTFKSPSLAL